MPVPSVTAVSVDGAVNEPGQDPNGADGEVLLDIEVAGAVAPGAAQVVYFAPNTDQGFVDAVSHRGARQPDADRDQHQLGPVRGRVDRAGAGPRWTRRWPTRPRWASRCASRPGDNGSGDAVTDGQPHTSTSPRPARTRWPAAGPACTADAATGAISSETVWNDGAGQRRHRRRGERHVPAAVLAGVGRGARPARRRRRRRVACPTWPAAPTRRPATRCWWTGSRWWSAAPARSPRCGRR